LAEDASLKEEASSLGPRVPVGGAGRPSNDGEGVGAPCFLPFLCFPRDEARATWVMGATMRAHQNWSRWELIRASPEGNDVGGLVAGARATTVGGDVDDDVGITTLGDAAT